MFGCAGVGLGGSGDVRHVGRIIFMADTYLILNFVILSLRVKRIE